MAFFKTKPKITIICLVIATLGLGLASYFVYVQEATAWCGGLDLDCPGCANDLSCCHDGNPPYDCGAYDGCASYMHCYNCDTSRSTCQSCCSASGSATPGGDCCVSHGEESYYWTDGGFNSLFCEGGECDDNEAEPGYCCGDDDIGFWWDSLNGDHWGRETFINNNPEEAICDNCPYGIADEACCDNLGEYLEIPNRDLEYESSPAVEITVTDSGGDVDCVDQPNQCLSDWPINSGLDDHQECCIFNLGYEGFGSSSCLWDGSNPELYWIDNLKHCYSETGSLHVDSPIVEQEYNPNCCNDDSHEFMTRRWCDPFGDLVDREGLCDIDLNDQACCRLPYERPDLAYNNIPKWGHLADCVYDGQCYSHYNYYSGDINEVAINLPDDQSTDREICGDFNTFIEEQSGGAWVDPDMNANSITMGWQLPGVYCQMAGNETDVDTTWVASSTTTPCQTADRWSTNNQCWDIDTAVWGDPATNGYCCGDDTNEYYTETDGRTACCATEGAEVNESGECTSGESCEPAGQINYYKITNSAGETVARFGDKGYLEIASSTYATEVSDLTDPGGNIFMIKNSSDELVFYIDESGYLATEGVLVPDIPVASLNGHVPVFNDFAIQDSNGDVVAVVDEDGNTFLAQCIKTGVTF